MTKLFHFLHILGQAFRLVCGLWKKAKPGQRRIAHIKWVIGDDDGTSFCPTDKLDELWSLE